MPVRFSDDMPTEISTNSRNTFVWYAGCIPGMGQCGAAEGIVRPSHCAPGERKDPASGCDDAHASRRQCSRTCSTSIMANPGRTPESRAVREAALVAASLFESIAALEPWKTGTRVTNTASGWRSLSRARPPWVSRGPVMHMGSRCAIDQQTEQFRATPIVWRQKHRSEPGLAAAGSEDGEQQARSIAQI
jgi:hypothetical protein